MPIYHLLFSYMLGSKKFLLKFYDTVNDQWANSWATNVTTF